MSKKKKTLGSYPSTSVVGSMLLALLVLGSFGFLTIVGKNTTQYIQENMQMQVYLSKDITKAQLLQIEKTLSDKPYVLRKEGEPLIHFISKDSAAAQFIRETGEDFFEFLGENPLRDSYVINLDLKQLPEGNMEKAANEIENISGVFEVDYVKNLINDINTNITKIGLFLMAFALALVIMVIILINNTIKLALFSQRFLIRSMQLVGAKSGFIVRPFLYRSFLQGVLSGAFASGLLYAGIIYLSGQLPDIANLYGTNGLLILFCTLLLIGGFVGFTGTYLAVRKYLKMSLDELY